VRPADIRHHDIPRRVATRVAEIRAEAQTGGKRLAPDAMALLAAIPWQDDLSELREALARLVAGVAREEIHVEDVLAHVRLEPSSPPSGTLRSARRQFEREYIALVLRHYRGSVGDAARALGIQRTNLYRKARQLGISVARPPHQS
jgi:DNA-binding NtrC family response regulator